MVKKKGAQKSKILSCNDNAVVARSNVKVDGVTIKRGTKGEIVKQRKTPHGYPRATINFKGKGTHEVASSKLKCA